MPPLPMTIENLNQLSSLIVAAILVAAFFVPSLCEVVIAVGIVCGNLSRGWQILHSHVWSRFPTRGSFTAFFGLLSIGTKAAGGS